MSSVVAATGTVRLLIIGPPGSGKGTQAAKLAQIYGIPAISTGDIFRANIAEQTELGKRVQQIVESGSYVPDSVTNELVRERLSHDDVAVGFLLDGYPRTIEQVGELDRILAKSSTGLDAVIQLVADVDEVVERLRKRALVEGRADDTEEVLRHRQDVYAEQTAQLIDVYASRGIVVTVDALGEVDEVTERIVSALAAR